MERKEKVFAAVTIILMLAICALSSYWIRASVISKLKEPVTVAANSKELYENDDDKLVQIVKQDKIEIAGVNDFEGFTGDNEAILRIGMNKNEILNLNKKNMNKVDFLKKISGKLYTVNLLTGKKSVFNIGEKNYLKNEIRSKISPDGNMLYFKPIDVHNSTVNSNFIYDMKKNTIKKLGLRDDFIGTWSNDSKFIIGSNWNENYRKLVIYNVENGSIKNIDLDSRLVINPMIRIYSEDGSTVYVDGFYKNNSKNKYDRGIFKFDIDSKKLTKFMMLPYEKNPKEVNNFILSYQCFAVVGENKVVFNGCVNGEVGLYIYDNQNKKYIKAAESKESQIVPFSISPADNKIAYAIYSGKGNNGLWTIYAARVAENGVINRIAVSSVNYDSIIELPMRWEIDGNKLAVFKLNNSIVDNRVISDKCEVNTISFK